MSRIVVVRPDGDVPEVARVTLAPRVPLPDHPVIGLIVNGKPFAGEMLEAVVGELQSRTGKQIAQVLIALPIIPVSASLFS